MEMKKRTYASRYLSRNNQDNRNQPHTTSTTNSASLGYSQNNNNNIFHDIEDSGASRVSTTTRGISESKKDDNGEKKKNQKLSVSPSVKILLKILVTTVVMVFVGLSILTSAMDRLSLPSLFAINADMSAMSSITHNNTKDQSSSTRLSPKAYPVYGTRIEYHDDIEMNTTTPIEVVYAFPHALTQQQRSSSSSTKVKGLVVLLHACSHSALKFFTPSIEKCPTCVGLAEEMEVVRQILKRNYAVLAVTSTNRRSGCWNLGNDIRRVQVSMNQFMKDHPEEFSLSSQLSSSSSSKTRIFAVGTSSGGTMAAKLFAEGIVDGVFSGVMAISQPRIMNEIVERLSASIFLEAKKSSVTSFSSSSIRPLVYIAPMPKDHGTTRQSKEHYDKMLQQIQQRSLVEGRHDVESQQSALLEKMLYYDDTSCTELTVTTQYLYDHVYGMTKDGAQLIVDKLIEAQYLDNSNGPDRQKLVRDPTRTPWRDVLVQIPPPSTIFELPTEFLDTVKLRSNNLSSISSENQHDQQQQHSQTFLWDVYELTPGYSSLAKALHRAWAYHEYCSEAVGKGLDMFVDTVE